MRESSMIWLIYMYNIGIGEWVDDMEGAIVRPGISLLVMILTSRSVYLSLCLWWHMCWCVTTAILWDSNGGNETNKPAECIARSIRTRNSGMAWGTKKKRIIKFYLALKMEKIHDVASHIFPTSNTRRWTRTHRAHSWCSLHFTEHML